MKAGIAGFGILGRLMAFAFRQAGWEVTVYDQGHDKSCSTVAAGLLTPVTEIEKSHFLIYQLGVDALTMHWPAILAQLNQDIYFRRNGSVVMAHARDYAELLRFITIIQKKLPMVNIVEVNNQFYIPNEGHIDAQAVFHALAQNVQHQQVLAVAPRSITCADHIAHFDWVIDCRGLGAKAFFSDLRGVRGEIIWLHAPSVNLTQPVRLLHPRYSVYIVPRPGRNYVIGASEIESNDASEISVRTTLELLTAASTVDSGFLEARIKKTLTHCRPTLVDHLPKIKFADGLVAVNGLYRHGYLIAPTLVAEVLTWCQQRERQYPQIWEKIDENYFQ